MTDTELIGTSPMTRAGVLRGGLGAAGALLLAACAGVPGGGSGTNQAAQSKKPVKLVFEWPTYTQPKEDWAGWAMQAYTQKNPHVTIEPLWNKNPTEILTTMLAAGQPPDVGWFGVGHWAFHQAFEPVEPFLAARRIRLDDYLPKVVDAMKWRGKMLAFPMGINTSAMFVNKAHYQRAGLSMPTDDQTWDDLIAAGRRIVGMGGDGGGKVWGNNAAYYTTHWPAAYGGQWLDADGTKVLVNNPLTLRVLTVIREMWERHGVSPDPKEHAAISTNATAGFTGGHYAAFTAGTWGLDPARSQSFDWDIVEVPTLVDGSRRVKGAFCGTEEIFIIKGGPNQEASADFGVWLIGSEHLTWAGNKGHIIPAHQKTAREAFINPPGESRPRNLQAFVRAAGYAPPIIGHPLYADLNRAWGAAVSKWLGSAANPASTITAQQALQEAQTEMQRLLDDWNRANPR